MKHIFSKPFTFEEKEYKELDLKLETLTGEDLASTERELMARGIVTVQLETSKEAMMILAAKSAKVPSELIKALPINEASKITMAVQSFLIG